MPTTWPLTKDNLARYGALDRTDAIHLATILNDRADLLESFEDRIGPGGVGLATITSSIDWQLRTTPLDYVIIWDGTTAFARNCVTQSIDFSGPDFALVWNQVVGLLSRRPTPGGKLSFISWESTKTIPVTTSLFSCPGLCIVGMGGGKRGSQNGRNVGTVLQATSGFVAAPLLSYLNQTFQQPPVTAPSLATTGSGSMTTGTHYYAYAFMDAFGFQSPLSPAASAATNGGSAKGVNATVPAWPAWAVSANVYRTFTNTPSSGTARNDQFWLAGTVTPGSPTLVDTLSDTNGGFTWNGTPFYRNDDLMLDARGQEDRCAATQVQTWSASHTYGEGEVVQASPDNGHLFRTWVGGKSGASQPSWNTASGTVTGDGAADWIEIGTSTGALSGTAPTTGQHSWTITFMIGGIEYVGSVLSTYTVSSGKPVLLGLPIGPAGTTARKIYRSATPDTGALKLVATVSDNTTLLYLDSIADGALGATCPVPVVLKGPREQLVLQDFTLDCNGVAAGTSGADIGCIVEGSGSGNFAAVRGVMIMNFNVTGLRLGYNGEQVGSSDVYIMQCGVMCNKGTTGNINALVQLNCGDATFAYNNFASMSGNNCCTGIHVQAGSANLRVTITHIGGGGGGQCNVMVEAINQFWISDSYLDNVQFPLGAIWVHPVIATGANNLKIAQNIFNMNDDVPMVTLDGGAVTGTGHGTSMLRMTDNVSPGYSTGPFTAPVFKAIRGYPNGYGIAFTGNDFRALRQDILVDSSNNNGITVTVDIEDSNMLTTSGNAPKNFLSLQRGTYVGSGTNTIWIVQHRLRAPPGNVQLTPANPAAAGTGWYVSKGAIATVTSIAVVSGTTYRYGTSAPHGLAVGDKVFVSAQVPTGYSGLYTVSNVSDTVHFDINIGTNPGTATAFGVAFPAQFTITTLASVAAPSWDWVAACT